MTRGKKPIPQPGVEVLDAGGEQQAEQQMAVMRETAISDENEKLQALFDLGRAVGVAGAMRAVRSFSAAAEIHAFEKINKSRAFKDLCIEFPDGFRAAESIDEFCRAHFGRGYKSMQDQKRLLQELGEEAYESVRKLELPRTQLRLLLTLPEDDRAAVEEAMRDGSGKDEVVTLIQSLANKLDETREQVEHLKGELKATEEISAEKTQRIEQLQRETKRIAAAAPDQVFAELQAESTRIHHDIHGAIVGQLRQALIALNKHGAERGEGPAIAFMGGLVAQLQTDLVALRDEFGLPDVDRGEVGWVDGD